MTKKIEKILKELPHNPGVYIMKNGIGKIIYVGKSVNLKSRVNSYFNGLAKLNFAKQNMVSQIRDIDTIETKNEVEALVLETNLIKRHRPKYNILMKDDKNLVYIKITDDPIPEIIKTRIKNSHGEYFGPFPSTSNVNNILDILRKVFKLRSCHIKFAQNGEEVSIASRKGINTMPCIDYYIGLCDGPCMIEPEPIKKYKSNIEKLRGFLKGNVGEVIKDLEVQMAQKAKNMEYEEAAKLRDQIKSVKELQEKQLARDTIPGDNDVIVVMEKYGNIYIGVTEVRNSEISAIHSVKIENNLEEDREQIFSEFLQTRYVADTEVFPKKLTLITTEHIKDETLLEYFKENRIKIDRPSLGNKLEIMNFTKNNLLNFAYKDELGQISKRTLTKQTMNNLLRILGYDEKPKQEEIVFECYDISHLGGTNTVASRSVIVNGRTANSRYKKYKLETIKEGEIDDFKSLREILQRRTKEVLRGGEWPDLIIIDGGKGQLSSALESIKKELVGTDMRLPEICSLAKREEEIFIPGKSEPILLEKGSSELSLVQKIRDEAHRFAINFNRSKRIKEMKRNILEEIPGFGPKTRSKLLKAAGNIDNIASLPKNELESILNKNQIEKLEEYGII